MKYIKSYKSYNDSQNISERNIKFLSDIDVTKNDDMLFRKILEKMLLKHNIDDKVRNEINNFISSNSNMINESFFDKLKERVPNAIKVSNLLSDKAEGILANIVAKSKDVFSFVKKISEGIKEFFLLMVEKGKELFSKLIQDGKLKDKIDELSKTKKEGLKVDLKTSKDVANWYRKDFIDKFTKVVDKNVTDFVNVEHDPIEESYKINEEKGNVISTFVHKIEQYPPFSWLHKISKAGEAGSNQLIKMISDLTHSLGGPTFQLPVISLLIGVVIEQLIKNNTGHWLIDIAGATTPFGFAIKGIKILALTVALIISIDAIIGGKILGSEHVGEEHGDEDLV